MKNAYLLLLLSFSFVHVFAQNKKKVEQKTVVDATPLLYAAYWGPVKGGEVSATQISVITQAPLIVKDNKGNILAVTGFRINYTFTSSYKDEETGKTNSVKDFRVMDINNSNQLSKDWIESIKDNIKPGDQILFNKILFRNASGKNQYAPDLKISVK